MSPTARNTENESGYYVTVGDLVAGKYRVERVLGSGGMAFVLSAKHVELDEHFALKFLDKRFLGNAKITERFTQEAKAVCRIRSEHVARVYDVGIHEGAPFFVMEHLEGRDLSTVIGSCGALAIEDAVEYAMQACEALAVAHCHGIVHRDIKPENLFLVEREGLPIIKVLDFGISKVALTGGQPASRLTGELTLGTPCYMSPEQIRSTACADARSDQWSLGVVLYELLAGIEAFRADSVSAVCAAVLEREPEPLHEIRPDVPAGLADVVMKCLAKEPADRFADVGELAAALLPYAPTRALVWAERACSVIQGSRELRISSVRSTSMAPISSRHPSGQATSPRSTSPVARAVDAEDMDDSVPPKRRGRRGSRAGVVLMGFAVVVAASVAAFELNEMNRRRIQSSSTSTAAAAGPAEPAQVNAPIVAARPMPTVEASSLPSVDESERGSLHGSAHAPSHVPSSKRAPLSGPRGAAHASSAQPISSTGDGSKRASSGPSASASAGASASATASASAAIELGY